MSDSASGSSLEGSGPEKIRVLITGVNGAAPAFIPCYEHEGDAGADLRSAIDFDLHPFERVMVPTGICVAVPDGYVILVHPRSGLGYKRGVTLPNAPGTIDSGYRGEIRVPLINLDPKTTWHFSKGDRIAQMVIQRYVRAQFQQVDSLPSSQRSTSGFGSTGLAE
jgi:dUTP pyrophosphatase